MPGGGRIRDPSVGDGVGEDRSCAVCIAAAVSSICGEELRMVGVKSQAVGVEEGSVRGASDHLNVTGVHILTRNAVGELRGE